MNRRAALLIAALAFAAEGGPAIAQQPLKCGADEVAAELAVQLPDKICLRHDITLKSLVFSLAIDAPAVTLSDIVTTAEEATPPKKICEARLGYDVVLHAEMLGPLHGDTINLRVRGGRAAITYSVAFYDDGRVLVRFADVGPCWQAEAIENLDAPPPTPETPQ